MLFRSGEPASSRWVSHLDASDFPKNQTLPIATNDNSRINNVDSVLYRTPYTADYCYYTPLRGICQRNGIRIFIHLIFEGRGRFLFQKASRNVCLLLLLWNGECKRSQNRLPIKRLVFYPFRALTRQQKRR